MGFFARDDQAVIWRGPMLHKALEQFLTDVHWGEPDLLVVDLPPGTGDVSLSVAELLPDAEVIVVTTPQPAAQRVAQRSAAMAERVNLTVIGVVENMSWFIGDDGKRYELFGAGGGEELAASLGVPLLGQIPLVPRCAKAATSGVRSRWPSPRVRPLRRSSPSPSGSRPCRRAGAATRSCGSPEGRSGATVETAGTVLGMDVRIGVLHSPKELALEVAGSADEVESSVNEVLAGQGGVLWLTDVSGRRVGVPSERVVYVEIDADGAAKRVGFGPA